MEDLKYWIWFSRLENLSPKKLLEILKTYGEPKVVFNKSKEELISNGLTEKKQMK